MIGVTCLGRSFTTLQDRHRTRSAQTRNHGRRVGPDADPPARRSRPPRHRLPRSCQIVSLITNDTTAPAICVAGSRRNPVGRPVFHGGEVGRRLDLKPVLPRRNAAEEARKVLRTAALSSTCLRSGFLSVWRFVGTVHHRHFGGSGRATGTDRFLKRAIAEAAASTAQTSSPPPAHPDKRSNPSVCPVP
jgi:hypothetical protein